MICSTLDLTSTAAITSVCSEALADALVSPELVAVIRLNRSESNVDFIARRRERMIELATATIVQQFNLPEIDARIYVERTFDASMRGLGIVRPLGRTHAVLA